MKPEQVRMANETIAQVPTDVTDPVILKRFLSRLVERLDITLGFRGDDAYATSSTVTGLAKSTKNSVESLTSTTEATTKSVTELNTALDTLAETVTTHTDQLGQLQQYQVTELRDFNVEGWPLHSYFTCLGSEVVNPPITLVAGDTYTFFVDVLPNYVQSVVVLDSSGVSTRKYRSGLTWSGVAANAWS